MLHPVPPRQLVLRLDHHGVVLLFHNLQSSFAFPQFTTVQLLWGGERPFILLLMLNLCSVLLKMKAFHPGQSGGCESSWQAKAWSAFSSCSSSWQERESEEVLKEKLVLKTHIYKSLAEGLHTDLLGRLPLGTGTSPWGRGRGFSSPTPGKDGRSALALPSSPWFWFPSSSTPVRCKHWGLGECSFPQCSGESKDSFSTLTGWLSPPDWGGRAAISPGLWVSSFPLPPWERLCQAASLPDWSTEVPRDPVCWDVEKVRAGRGHATCSWVCTLGCARSYTAFLGS